MSPFVACQTNTAVLLRLEEFMMKPRKALTPKSFSDRVLSRSASASISATILVGCLLFGSAKAQNPNSQAKDVQYDEAIAKARSLLTEKKNKEAVHESERAIKLDESRWEAYVLAASGYSSQQLYDDAIGYLQMALPRAPEDKKDKIREALTESRAALARPASSASAAAPAVPSRAMSSPQAVPSQAEVVLWKTIENSTRVSDYETYLDKYPDGAFAALAANRMAEIEKKKQNSLEGSSWQASVNWSLFPQGSRTTDIALKLLEGGSCEETEVEDGRITSSKTCTYKRIGTAIYIEVTPDTSKCAAAPAQAAIAEEMARKSGQRPALPRKTPSDDRRTPSNEQQLNRFFEECDPSNRTFSLTVNADSLAGKWRHGDYLVDVILRRAAD
jgi:hypothetical protein